jgi:HPt (histidine-containing phosphotransfer) domain-containing protein
LEAALAADKISDLISLFLNSVEGRLKQIDAFAEAQDFEGLAKQAHILVSTAGNLGAVETSMLAREIERACAERNGDKLRPMLMQFHESCAAASDGLRAWLVSRTGSNTRANTGCRGARLPAVGGLPFWICPAQTEGWAMRILYHTML